MAEKVFQALEQASKNRAEVVEIFVEEVGVLTEKINQKFPGIINLHLEFYDSPFIEAYGWVLDIHQAEADSVEDDSYLHPVGKVEISELEVNEGKVKASFYEWFERGEKKSDSFGKSISLAPVDFIKYLRSISEIGESRPELIHQENSS